MSEPALIIRGLHRADVDAVIEVFRASVRIVARRDYSHDQVMAWAPDEIDAASWAARYDTRRGWVAELDSQIVGFGELEGHEHLDMMYVHPAHQQRGVATALLQQIEAAARGLGARNLLTEASITARPFFERRGFLVVAPQTVTVRNQRFVNFRMTKSLPPPAGH